MAKTTSKPKTQKRKISNNGSRVALFASPEDRILRELQMGLYPNNMSMIARANLQSKLLGLTVKFDARTLYDVVQFSTKSIEDMQRVTMPGFQDYWKSREFHDPTCWEYLSGTYPEILNFCSKTFEFKPDPIIAKSTSDLVRHTYGLALWDIKVTYTLMEFKGNGEHLANVISMKHNEVEKYAADNDLNFGVVSLDVSSDSHLAGMYIDHDPDTEGGFLINVLKTKEVDGVELPITVISFGYDNLEADRREQIENDPDFKDFEVVNFSIHATLRGV